MITVKEFFDYTLETDMLWWAHATYWAISKQIVRMEDDCEGLRLAKLDEHKINSLVDRNVLGIGRIKLFVIEAHEKSWFAFYFAENALEAYGLHGDLFRGQGGKITRADRLMVAHMTFAETGKMLNLYEYRKQVVQFPAFIGHAKAGEHVLYRVGVNA